MNVKEYLQYTFCTTTESMLADRIKLAEALEKYQGGNFEVEKYDLFEFCVQKIISGEYDRYNFDDARVKKTFRISSSAKCTLYHNLIFFEVGKRLSVNTDELKLKQLDEYGDKMDYGFYLSFTINEAKLNKLISRLNHSSILNDTRSLYGYKNEVFDFCNKDIKTGMSDEEIISLITPYNAGSYVELPEYIHSLSYLLLRDKKYELWVTMLVKLKYFPLQGAMLYQVRTLQEFTSILCELKRPNLIHRKVILHLLRERFFQIISKQPKTLQRGLEYLAQKRLSVYGKVCQELIDEWDNNIERDTYVVFRYFSEELGLSNCSEWYSKKRNQYKNGNQRFVEYEQKSVDVIGKILSDFSNPARWNTATADLNTIFYYICQTEIKQITRQRSILLIKALSERLYSNKNYYQINLDEDFFKHLRLSYGCLIRSELDPIQILQSFNSSCEGYCVDYVQAEQIRRGDMFWLSMLLLGAGEKEDEHLFESYVSLLLQRFFVQRNDAKEYIIPLFIAELVYTQVFSDKAANFEMFIIHNLPNLCFVLNALMANQGDMSQPVREELLKRISLEWDIEVSLMKQRKASDFEVLNEYIQKIKEHNNSPELTI